jgi:hypothetical protein
MWLRRDVEVEELVGGGWSSGREKDHVIVLAQRHEL